MIHSSVFTFVKVVECGSFAKAAELLHFSSVSVMKQIDALEDRLQIKLLNRSHGGVVPTEAGKLIYENAKRLIAEVDDTVNQAWLMSEASRSVIRIGTSQLRPASQLQHCLPDGLSGSFPFEFRLVPFSDEHNGFTRAIESLGRDLDMLVAIIYSGNHEWEYSCRTRYLGSIDCCIGIPSKHRLYTKKRLTWDDLSGEIVCIMKRGKSEFIDKIRDDMEKNHPDVIIRDVPGYYDMDVFNFCVERGLLFEVPETWKDIHPSVSVVPMDWDFKLPYGIFHALNADKNVLAAVELIAAGAGIDNMEL